MVLEYYDVLSLCGLGSDQYLFELFLLLLDDLWRGCRVFDDV